MASRRDLQLTGLLTLERMSSVLKRGRKTLRRELRVLSQDCCLRRTARGQFE